MSDAIIGLVGVIVGASIGFLGTWIINRQTIREARAKVVKDRLEELYLLVGYLADEFTFHFISLSKVMTNELTYNDHIDMIVNDSDKRQRDFQRIEMIVDVYAPTLSARYGEIKKMRENVNKIIFQHKEQYRTGDTDGASHLEPYRQSVLTLCRTCEEFQKEIASTIRLS